MKVGRLRGLPGWAVVIVGAILGVTVTTAVTALFFEAMLVNDRPWEMLPGVLAASVLGGAVWLLSRILRLALGIVLGAILAGALLPVITNLISVP